MSLLFLNTTSDWACTCVCARTHTHTHTHTPAIWKRSDLRYCNGYKRMYLEIIRIPRGWSFEQLSNQMYWVQACIHRSHSGVKHMGLVRSQCEKRKKLVSNYLEGKTERSSLGDQEGICIGRNTNSQVIHCPQSGAGKCQGPPESAQLTPGMNSAHLPPPHTWSFRDDVSPGLAHPWL